MNADVQQAKAARLHIIGAMCDADAMTEVRALIADLATALASAKDPQVADAAISIFFLERLIAADSARPTSVKTAGQVTAC